MTYQAYLIDLDGTMYRGQESIPTASDFIRRLQDIDIPFVFITNNATLTPSEIQRKLINNFDIDVSEQQIYTSSLAVKEYLVKNYKQDKIFVIGEPSFTKLLADAGLQLCQSEEANLVVQALDRQITYQELTKAVHIINRTGEFIVTNDDRLLPNGEKSDPSSGAITAFLSYATNVSPKIFGKPHQSIVKGALDRLQVDPKKVALIGDNYDTDIMAGINMGLDTIMVLTGVSTKADLTDVNVKPHYILNNLSEWEVINE